MELSVKVCDYFVHVLGVIGDGVCLLVCEGCMWWCSVVFIKDVFVGYLGLLVNEVLLAFGEGLEAFFGCM